MLYTPVELQARLFIIRTESAVKHSTVTQSEYIPEYGDRFRYRNIGNF